MKSIKELYRIGNGPSSSHTMGPRKTAQLFANAFPGAARFTVTLYGSLAATGKGGGWPGDTPSPINHGRCLQQILCRNPLFSPLIYFSGIKAVI